MPDRAHPLLQAGDLDAVALVAVLLQPRRVGGHEREPLDARGAARGRRSGGSSRNPTVRNAIGPLGVGAPVVVEGAHPQPLGAQQVEVDVGDASAAGPSGTARCRRAAAVLPDHRLAVPGEVGRRLALARGRVDVGREAPGRRRPRQQAARLRAPDGDRAARQVRQHRRPGQRRRRARRHRHPHVLADLDVQDEARHVLGGEEQVGPERHVRAARGGSCRAGRRPARSGGARRTRGRSAGTTWAPRRAAARGARPPPRCGCGCGPRTGRPTTSTGSRSADAATISPSAASAASSRVSCRRMSSIE